MDTQTATPAQTAWAQAIALHQAGRLDEAAKLYTFVIENNPRHSDAMQLLGLIALNQGDARRAADLIARSIEINPASFGAQVNLGASYKALGERARAVQCYDNAVALKPDYLDGWIHAGNLLGELDHVDASLARFDGALKIDPRHAGALNNRGNALRRLGRHALALESFGRLLDLDPARADARLNRGVVLLDMGNSEAAIADFDVLLAANPAHAVAWNNRCNALMRLRRYEEALPSLDRALELAPDYAPAWANRGNLMLALCRYAEARVAFERARELAPTLDEAHWNMATLELLEGHFERGWRAFEARWTVSGLEARRHRSIAAWLGDADVRGKRLLLWHEQGLGDTIQFCRFARDVAARGAKVVLEVQPALKRLIASSLPDIEVIATGEPTGPCDFGVPLMSLPLALGIDVASMVNAPRYLHADPAIVSHWIGRLGERGARPRVGLAISGNIAHHNDANRSIRLQDCSALLQAADSLIIQKGLRKEDADALAQFPRARYVGDTFGDFSDSAAVIDQCDLVITVDTSVAHLAGALGKPTWLLVPANPDWRWQLDRDDSPWYASARLFRQSRIGDWSDVVDRVARETEQWRVASLRAQGSDPV